MQPLEQFDVIVPVFQKMAANTAPSQLDDPTPCEGWKVRDLFGHLIGGATTFAAAVRGAEPPAIPTPDDSTMAATAMTAIADIDGAFREDGALARTVTTPFGDMPGEVFARLLAFDLLVHTWDLGRSTGQAVDVPGDVIAAVDGFARQAVTPDLRGPGTFGPEQQAPEGASALDRLAAFSGRTV